MTEDYYWGTTLTSSNKELKWEPDALKENGAAGDVSFSAKGEHALVVKQALLGPDAEDNDVNVIEVETTGYKSNIQQPIVVLTGGKQSHILLDLNFPDPPVTFRLIKGKGPVHLSGNHVIGNEQYNDEDDEDEDDIEDFDDQGLDEEDEEDEAEDEKKKEEKGTAKKRTNSNSGTSPAKKKKKGKDD